MVRFDATCVLQTSDDTVYLNYLISKKYLHNLNGIPISSVDFLYIIFVINFAYGRHRISRPMRIVAPIFLFLLAFKKRLITILC